jgi:hypothetical protein
MADTPDYFDRYENFALTRSDSGVLTLRFHTNVGPVTFTGTTHATFPRLLEDVAAEGTLVGMALEGLTAANLAYLSQPQ